MVISTPPIIKIGVTRISAIIGDVINAVLNN
jgi:hypothetical protein